MIKILTILLITQIGAEAHKWHNLKPLKKYPPSAYTLKSDINCLEVREYIWDTKHKRDNHSYHIVMSTCKRPIKPNVLKSFRRVTPNFSKEANIRKIGTCLLEGCSFSQSFGFIIDNKGKMWKMNEISNVARFLGDIDTPAELNLILWMRNEPYDKLKYQKSAKGYVAITEYDNSINNFGECGHFVYRLNINKRGQITKKKLLKKTSSKNGCMCAD
jgi:hypothetical protein